MRKSSLGTSLGTLAIVVLVLSGITLLCSLGTWQLLRAKQKSLLLSQQASAVHRVPLDMAKDPPLRFARVSFLGHPLNEKIILLDNKTLKGHPGYHVIVPVLLNASTVILVNRGFIPQGPSRLLLPSISPLPDPLLVEGMLDSVPHNRFTGATLEKERIQWPLRVQKIDLPLLERLLEKSLHPMIVVELTAVPQQGITPAKHQAYAFQWFALAALLAGLSLLKLRNEK